MKTNTVTAAAFAVAAAAGMGTASEYDLRYADAYALAVGGDGGEVYSIGASAAYERGGVTLGGSGFYITDDDGDYTYGILGYGAYEFPSQAIGFGGLIFLGDDSTGDAFGFVGAQFPVGATWDAGLTAIFDDDTQSYIAFAGTDIGANGHALGMVVFSDDNAIDTTFIGQVEWDRGTDDYGILVSFDESDFFGIIADWEREIEGLSRGRDMRYGLSGVYTDFGGGDDSFAVSASLGVELQDNVWLEGSLGYGEDNTGDSVIWSLGVDFELGRRGETYQRVQDIEFTGLDLAF